MASSEGTLTSLWVDEGQGSPMRTTTASPLRTAGTVEIKNDVMQFYKDAGLESVAKEAGFIGANGELLSVKAEPIVSLSQSMPKRQISPMRTTGTVEINNDVIQFYKDTGLENVAKETGFIGANGEVLNVKAETRVSLSQPISKPVQMIAVPVGRSPGKTTYIPFSASSTNPSPSMVKVISTPQRVTPQRVIQAHVVTPKQHTQTQYITATPISIESPQPWHNNNSSRKRSIDFMESDFSDGRRRKCEKGGKGLRHFSMKVCEKVQTKGVTSYNEVADELVHEFTDFRNMTPTDQYDQKNIRRRVYDALNVLMAMNIISKEKKEIRWIGLPTNSAQECHNLELEKKRRTDRIKQKTQQLQELILQQIAFKNLVQRNKVLEERQGAPTPNSAIQLPFIIVNTSKKTVIDCSISNDKYEYLFNFDNTFEIHDDIEVLKRMGMAFGLEKGQCGEEDLKKACRMVPQALQSYVTELACPVDDASTTSLEMFLVKQEQGGSDMGTPISHAKYSSHDLMLGSPLATPLTGNSLDSADAEVAAALRPVLSRQSSFSDQLTSVSARDTPDDVYSDDDSDSERSSPTDIS